MSEKASFKVDEMWDRIIAPKFDEMWDKFISTKVDELVSQNNGLKYFGISNKRTDYGNWKSGISQILKANLRENFKKYEEHIQSKQIKAHRLDRHKLAALFVLAIIRAKPFKVGRNHLNSSIPFRITNANNILALHTASFIIRSFLNKIYPLKAGIGLFDNEIPWITTDYGTYEDNFYFMLDQTGSSDIFGFNLLMLSKIFFHIEKAAYPDLK